MKRRFLGWVMGGACLVGGELAAPDPADALEAKYIVTVGEIPTTELVRGSSARLSIPFHVAEGFYVQANPPSSEFLVPLELSLDAAAGLTFAAPVYPLPEMVAKFGPEGFAAYSSARVIDVVVSVCPTTELGEHTLRGNLSYQACASNHCLFPTEIDVEIPIRVTGAAAPSTADSEVASGTN